MISSKSIMAFCLLTCPVALLAAGCGNFDLGASLFQHSLQEGDEGVVEEKECFDFWTSVHVISGYYLGEDLGEENFAASMLLLLGYELLEPALWPLFGESQLNQECDMAVGALGWLAWYLTDSN